MTCCLNAAENLLCSLINDPFLSSARHSKLSSKICPNSGVHSKPFKTFNSFKQRPRRKEQEGKSAKHSTAGIPNSLALASLSFLPSSPESPVELDQ